MQILKHGAGGFSLIEVLASVVLLAGLVSIVVQLSYGNTRRIKKSEKLEQIASFLELKMQELKEEFKAEELINLPSQDKGDFEEAEGYSWFYETQPLSLPPTEVLLSLVQLPQNELNSKMVQTLTEVLSSSIVELKLTVQHETKGKKRLSQSLVSYFVNYEDAPDLIFSQVKGLLPAGPSL